MVVPAKETVNTTEMLILDVPSSKQTKTKIYSIEYDLMLNVS